MQFGGALNVHVALLGYLVLAVGINAVDAAEDLKPEAISQEPRSNLVLQMCTGVHRNWQQGRLQRIGPSYRGPSKGCHMISIGIFVSALSEPYGGERACRFKCNSSRAALCFSTALR